MYIILKKHWLILFCFLDILLIFRAPAFAEQLNVIKVDGPINPVIAEYIVKSIDDAVDESAVCLIIQMDTPGGLDLSMRAIIKKILASEVPVVVYVSPSGARAASAGAIITLAAHVAVMAPGTNIGAAHPVSLGAGGMGEEMAAKVENDAAAYVESLAVKRKRNKEWAVKAVRESVSISEIEALKINVIDLVSPDLKTLIADINGKEVQTAAGLKRLNTLGAAVNYKKMGIPHRILNTLSDPNIAYILLLLGLAGLYFELSNPGVIFPGVIGGISLIIAFYSLQMLSANYAGVLLILLGVVLFIVELKVASYGLLSIGGVVALTLGSLMLFQSSAPYLRISLSVIIPSVMVTSAFFIVIAWLAVRAYRRKPTTGNEGLLHMTGVASSDIHRDGKVFIHGEYWEARSETPIPKGAEVRITKVKDMVLWVAKSEDKE